MCVCVVLLRECLLLFFFVWGMFAVLLGVCFKSVLLFLFYAFALLLLFCGVLFVCFVFCCGVVRLLFNLMVLFDLIVVMLLGVVVFPAFFLSCWFCFSRAVGCCCLCLLLVFVLVVRVFCFCLFRCVVSLSFRCVCFLCFCVVWLFVVLLCCLNVPSVIF